jgi:hypothetical protein
MAKVRHIGSYSPSIDLFYFKGEFANYTDILANAGTELNSFAYAKASQGIWLINYKSDGFYNYNGVAWVYVNNATLANLLNSINSKVASVQGGDWISIDNTNPTSPIVTNTNYLSVLSVSTPSASQLIANNNGVGYFDHLPSGTYNEAIIHIKGLSLAVGQSRILRFAIYDSVAPGNIIIQNSITLTPANNANVYFSIPLGFQKNIYPKFGFFCVAITEGIGGGAGTTIRGESATAENDVNWLFQYPITGAFPTTIAGLTRSSVNFKAQIWLRYNNAI